MNSLNLKRFKSERLASTKFSCVSCGKCCKNRGIELTFREIKRIATFLNLNLNDFQKKYIEMRDVERIKKSIHYDYRIKKKAFFLKMMRDDGICVFNEYKDGISRCGIYPARPNICHLFPFTVFFLQWLL